MTPGPRMRRRRRTGRALLAPPRDTGLRLREPARSSATGALVSSLGARIAGLCAVLLMIGGAAAIVSHQGPPLEVDLHPSRIVAPAKVSPASAATFVKPVAPTPVFGAFRGRALRLPVPPDAVTVFAFHQASPTGPLPIVSLVGKKSRSEAERLAGRIRSQRAAKKRYTPPASLATAAVDWSAYTAPNGRWTGRALELWRSGRVGPPNNAVDCGAAAGTPVFSPVDGTVMEIRPYRLYGKYFDYEIHIKPDAWSDVDVVLLHTTDPRVEPGRHVLAGVDRLSSVRKLSAIVPDMQLADYTLEGGDHTHLQINRIPKPGLPWIVGQDPPGTVRKHP